MIKKILTIGVLCLVSKIVLAQGKFAIDISAPSEANGTKVFVNIIDNNKRKVLKRDSAIIKDHKLYFSGTLSQPSNFINFFVRQNTGYSMATMVIDTGNNEFVMSALPKMDEPNKALAITALNSRSNQIKSGLDSIETYHYNKNGKRERSGITTLDKEALLAMNLDRINYLKSYPESYTALIALYEISLYHRRSIYANKVLSVFNTFLPELKSSSFGKEFYNEKMEYLKNLKSAKLGGPVPEFVVNDLAGKKFDNGSFAGQNYIIIFSATWCVPCQKSLPEIKKLYDRYRGRGLKVVYFNQDNDLIRWRQHVETNKLTWINVSEGVKSGDSKISKLFNVFMIPSYFIVNKRGTIIHNSVESGSDVPALGKSLALLYKD